ncbi:hypothetical protein MK139_07960 [bacterium]|nr:hypothetical protein [bacterium]
MRKAIIYIQCLLLLAFAVSCGTTDPSPVGIDLVGRSGGDVIELKDVRTVTARSRFKEIFPSVLGVAEEILLGRMNGVNYLSLYRVELSPTDFPSGSASGLTVDSLFIELSVLGNLSRGDLGAIHVFVPDEAWSEVRAFVDTSDFQASSFARSPLLDVTPALADSTVIVPLPNSLLTAAIAADPSSPVIEFGLAAADGSENFVVAVGSREATNQSGAPVFVAHYADGAGVTRTGVSLDTYFADREADPADGELLIQTGVFSAALMQFDLPTIPDAATVNVVELTMDYDSDRSFLSSLRLQIERVSVSGSDTTFALASGNTLNKQIINPLSSTFSMYLDQLMFHGWMSGEWENQGLILNPLVLNPVFESVPDLRYEWAVFSNPRLRIVYSLPPPIGS